LETAPSVAQASQDWTIGAFWVNAPHSPAFDAVLETWQTHWTDRLNCFKRRLTSGFVEGWKTQIRVLTCRRLGLFHLAHCFQRLGLREILG
jgi:transposase